jgi:hypothetical protein
MHVPNITLEMVRMDDRFCWQTLTLDPYEELGLTRGGVLRKRKSAARAGPVDTLRSDWLSSIRGKSIRTFGSFTPCQENDKLTG